MRTNDLKTVRKYRKEDESILARLINKAFDWLKAPQWFIFESKTDENKAQEEYVYIVSRIIAEAKKSIKIVGNENCFPIWNNKEIIEALRNSKAREIVVILCGDRPDLRIEDLDILRSMNKKNIRVYYSSDVPETHFLATDNSVLIEAQHNENEMASIAVFCLGSTIMNEVYMEKMNILKIKNTIYSSS